MKAITERYVDTFQITLNPSFEMFEEFCRKVFTGI